MFIPVRTSKVLNLFSNVSYDIYGKLFNDEKNMFQVYKLSRDIVKAYKFEKCFLEESFFNSDSLIFEVNNEDAGDFNFYQSNIGKFEIDVKLNELKHIILPLFNFEDIYENFFENIEIVLFFRKGEIKKSYLCDKIHDGFFSNDSYEKVNDIYQTFYDECLETGDIIRTLPDVISYRNIGIFVIDIDGKVVGLDESLNCNGSIPQRIIPYLVFKDLLDVKNFEDKTFYKYFYLLPYVEDCKDYGRGNVLSKSSLTEENKFFHFTNINDCSKRPVIDEKKQQFFDHSECGRETGCKYFICDLINNEDVYITFGKKLYNKFNIVSHTGFYEFFEKF